ncbi:MAG: inorganic phosphate transporter [Olsenella sp.]|nr:inorganic phosphate transporter [Olsenella sp.]
MTTSIMGAGSAKGLRKVNWGVAADIVQAWFVTLPVTMLLGGAACWLIGLLV